MKKKKSNSRILLDKLEPEITKSKHKISLKTSLLNFHNDLQELNNNYVKKNYSDKYIVGQIFCNVDKPLKASQISPYVKCSLFLACKQLGDLINRIKTSENGLTNSNIKKHKELLRGYIFDLIPLIEYINEKTRFSLDYFDGGKNYNNSTFEIFNYAYLLQYSSTLQENFIEQKYASNLSTFTLRQALELRFKKVIGIAAIYDSNDQAKIKHDFFPNFINSNLSLFDTPYLSLTELMNIYKWTNFFIHYGMTPRIWELNFALKYAEPLFTPGEHTSNGRKKWSVNGSVIIHDLNSVRTKFAEYLSDNTDRMLCVNFVDPEAIVV